MGDVHDASYYAKCMMGGILSCGITHTAIAPLDIIKCRKQVSRLLILIRLFLGGSQYLQECHGWVQSHQSQ